MKRFLYFGIAGLIFSQLGCDIDFDGPVYSPPELVVDATPYLGEWDLVSIAGEEVEAGKLHLSVAELEGATLTATYSGQGKPGDTHIFQLTVIDERTIASVECPPDSWRVFQVTLQQEGAELILRALSFEPVKSDVVSQVVPGEVLGTWGDERFECIHITASGVEARSYLEENPEVFGSEYLFVRASP